jgi:hypothetical protein
MSKKVRATEVSPAVVRTKPSREEVERRAYEIYEERGKTEGFDVDDWLQAERELGGSGEAGSPAV